MDRAIATSPCIIGWRDKSHNPGLRYQKRLLRGMSSSTFKTTNWTLILSPTPWSTVTAKRWTKQQQLKNYSGMRQIKMLQCLKEKKKRHMEQNQVNIQKKIKFALMKTWNLKPPRSIVRNTGLGKSISNSCSINTLLVSIITPIIRTGEQSFPCLD